MKKAWLVLFVLSLIFLSNFVFALSETNINFDYSNYNIKLLQVVSTNSANLEVNGLSGTISNRQSSPYTINPFIPSKNLSFVLTNTYYSSRIPALNNSISFITFFEKNLTEGSYTNLTVDGKIYQIIIWGIGQNNVIVGVNGDEKTITSKQTSQPYYISASIGGLSFILKDYYVSTRSDKESYADFLIGFNASLSDECLENWSCSSWNSCLNSAQSRTCTDSNQCGTIISKPSENQTCNSPSPPNNPVLNNNTPINPTPDSSCTNQCNFIGEKSCFNESFTQTCGYFDSSGCLTWGNISQCSMGPTGRICTDNGSCGKFPPIPNAKKDCDSIGYRRFGKYCSQDYKMINQNVDNFDCKNSYECITNNCINNKCSAIIQQNNYFIWVVIGVVILIVLLIILFFIFRK